MAQTVQHTAAQTTATPRRKTKTEDNPEVTAAIEHAERIESDQVQLGLLVPLIKSEHAATIAACETGLQHAIRCGQYLHDARKLTVHGKWESWVKDNFGFTPQTASGYIRCWKRQDKLPERNDLSYRRALKALSTKQEKKEGEEGQGNEGQGKKKKGKRKKGEKPITLKTLEKLIETYAADSDMDATNLAFILHHLGIEIKGVKFSKDSDGSEEMSTAK